MEQPNRFQKLVAQAKQHITEISPADARKQAEAGDAILIDVREESDWREGHAEGARHLSRGVIELEIEEQIPDVKKPIICYCGGGSRSALVAEKVCRRWDTRMSARSPVDCAPGKKRACRRQRSDFT